MGREQAGAAALQRVGSPGQGAILVAPDAKLLEVADPVVAADQDLEQQLPHGWRLAFQPCGDEALQRLRAGHEGSDQHLPLRRCRLAPERLQLGLRLRVHLLAARLIERLVEQPVAHLTRHVAQRGAASFARSDESVEERGEGRVGLRLGGLDPSLQDRQHHLGRGVQTALGLEDPEQDVEQPRRPLEALDAVVRDRPLQALEEAPRQASGLGIHRAQVGEEVLARARRSELLVLVGRGLATAEGGEVGEDPEDLVLQAAPLPVSRPLVRQPHVIGSQGLRLRRVGVEAQDQASHGLEVGERLLARRRGTAGGRAREGDAPASGAGLGILDIEPDEGRTRRYLRVGGDEQAAHPAREGSDHGRLHLHGLEHGQRVARLHFVSRLHSQGNHHRGGFRAHDPDVGAGETMGDAIHLDEVPRTLGDGDDRVATLPEDEPAFEPPERLDPRLETVAIDHEPVLPGPQTKDADLVELTPVMQLDDVARVVGCLGPEARGSLVEVRLLAGELRFVDLDRGLGEGGIGVGARRRRFRHGPFQPRRVHLGAAHLGTREEVQQEGPVGGAALEDDCALRQRSLEAGERLRPVASTGDDLRYHRVELRGHAVALGDPAVDPDPGTGGKAEEREGTRGGGEAAVRVLGVQPHLDRVTVGPRRLAFEAAAASDVQLELHEIEPGRDLGDGVLDLQPCVDLHEEEGLCFGLEEELHRARVAIPDGSADPRRRIAHGPVLLLSEGGGGALLQQLLVLALDRAVAHAEGPQGAVVVAHHLDLDVAHRLQGLLEEQRGIAEGLRGLGPRMGEGQGERLRRGNLSDSAPPAARTGLDHQGVAEPLRGAERLFGGCHRPLAPRHDRHAGSLGHPLGGDLVAEPAHGLGGRADEHDTLAFQHLHELGLLGDEAPARPHRLRARRPEGALQARKVEVAALAVAVPRVDVEGGAEVVRLVGLAHEHGPSVGFGEEGDGAQCGAALVVDLPRRVDEAHGRLAPIDDGDASEVRLHGVGTSCGQCWLSSAPRDMTARKDARPFSSTAAGSSTVR